MIYINLVSIFNSLSFIYFTLQLVHHQHSANLTLFHVLLSIKIMLSLTSTQSQMRQHRNNHLNPHLALLLKIFLDPLDTPYTYHLHFEVRFLPTSLKSLQYFHRLPSCLLYDVQQHSDIVQEKECYVGEAHREQCGEWNATSLLLLVLTQHPTYYSVCQASSYD